MKLQARRFNLLSWLNLPELISIGLLTLTLGIAFHSIETVHWIDPQPSLLTMLIASVVALWLAVKIKLPSWAVLVTGAFGGLAAAAWQTAKLIPGEDLLARFGSMMETLTTSQPSQSDVFFIVFINLITWAIGFLSAWVLIRWKNPWPGIFLGATALLINLRLATDDYYRFFLYFVLAALFLVGQTALARKMAAGASGSRFVGAVYHSMLVVVIAGVALGGAWLAPGIQAPALQTAVREKTDIGAKVNASSMNFLVAVNPKQSTIKNSNRDSLGFGGPVDLSDRILFTVTSSRPNGYWVTRRYEVYRASGWTSLASTDLDLERGTLTSQTPLSTQTVLKYTVTNKVKTDMVISGGELVSADIPVILRTMGKTNISASDVFSITSERLLQYNDSYSAVSILNQPTAAQLAAAGEQYPANIRNTYLQLPSDIPNRTRALSLAAAGRNNTPYAKINSIISYLSGYAYSAEGTSAPAGRDQTDDFLFSHKKGNCANFASAAVVMLRMAGVPSRLTAGYISEWNSSTSTATIMAKNYHSWVEVYFPGYGWVPFEVTPTFPALAGAPAGNRAEPSGTNGTFGGGIRLDEFNPEDEVPPGDIDFAATAPVVTPHMKWQKFWSVAGPVLLGLIALGAFLFLTMAIIRVRDRQRKLDHTAIVYSRMCFLGALSGLGPRASMTPFEYSGRLVGVFPAQAEDIDRIASWYSARRFGKNIHISNYDTWKLDRSWKNLRAVMLKRLWPFGRNRAG